VQCVVNTDCVAPLPPICGDNGTCVQCNSDRDCPLATPKCDQTHCVVK
jgi:hypothetical protein